MIVIFIYLLTLGVMIATGIFLLRHTSRIERYLHEFGEKHPNWMFLVIFVLALSDFFYNRSKIITTNVTTNVIVIGGIIFFLNFCYSFYALRSEKYSLVQKSNIKKWLIIIGILYIIAVIFYVTQYRSFLANPFASGNIQLQTRPQYFIEASDVAGINGGKQLADYIVTNLNRGVPEDVIYKALTNASWPVRDVDSVFNILKIRSNLPPFKIPEFGLEFQTVPELYDLKYAIVQDRVVSFSSQRLLDADKYCDFNNRPLGSLEISNEQITKPPSGLPLNNNQPIGNYYVYYIHPQAACTATGDLESSQLFILKTALHTLKSIKK